MMLWGGRMYGRVRTIRYDTIRRRVSWCMDRLVCLACVRHAMRYLGGGCWRVGAAAVANVQTDGHGDGVAAWA